MRQNAAHANMNNVRGCDGRLRIANTVDHGKIVIHGRKAMSSNGR